MLSGHRALLPAALGFIHLRPAPRDVAPLRTWLDTWRGLGDLVAAVNVRGYEVELRQFPRGWRANLYPAGTAHSVVVASGWDATPWAAMQHAAWTALTRGR